MFKTFLCYTFVSILVIAYSQSEIIQSERLCKRAANNVHKMKVPITVGQKYAFFTPASFEIPLHKTTRMKLLRTALLLSQLRVILKEAPALGFQPGVHYSLKQEGQRQIVASYRNGSALACRES